MVHKSTDVQCVLTGWPQNEPEGTEEQCVRNPRKKGKDPRAGGTTAGRYDDRGNQ